MDRVFEPRGWFTVPDGTDVSAFLTATDETQTDIPWGALGDMSIAAGRIGAGVHSWVHVHVLVTQVTYVVSGELTIRMRDPGTTGHYDLPLRAGQATVAAPGTLYQLRNDHAVDAQVLYIVSPSYVFELVNGEVGYDDASLVAERWEDVDTERARPIPAAADAQRQRDEAMVRMRARKEAAS